MPRAVDLTFGTLLRLAPLLLLIGAGLLVIFVIGQRFGIFGQRLTLASDSLANREAGSEREVSIYSLLPKDGIRSIDDPEFLEAANAESQMVSSELVLGLEIDGDARAYPINVLSRHEIVNDFVGGVPVAITYCPLCFTGIVYDRRVEDRVLEFGVSGKLVMNDLVMYDRQTDSLWQQILGEGIRGDFKGTQLTALPATHTTWAQWRASHPKTVVLDKGGSYESDSYAGYYNRSDSGVLGGSLSDDRLPAKELVLGIVLGGETKAYPFRFIMADLVVNDSLADENLLVVADPVSSTALSFSRQVDGRILTFTQAGEHLLSDEETGTTWSSLTGEAIEGPLSGSQLEQLPATYAFWFAWSDFYVHTEVYGLDAGSPVEGR